MSDRPYDRSFDRPFPSDRPEPRGGGAPTHAIWHIRDREGKKAFWTEIGVGFTNRDGSITLKLNLLPIDGGMMQVRPLEPREPRDY